MRNEFIKKLSEKLERDKDVMLLYADLGWPVLESPKEKFPDRVINIGISEQAMIGVAAGLANAGKRPYCYTMTAFMLYRAMEFVRDDLAFNNNKVVLVTVGSGFQDYPREGPTHNAIEDLSIGISIPNLIVLSPSDGKEVEIFMDRMDDLKSPVWLRITKSSEYKIHDRYDHLEIGKPLQLKEGNDLTIISVGQITKTALDVARMLEADNIGARVVECSSLKPLDIAECLAPITKERRGICVVIEESTGCLVNLVSRALVENLIPAKLISFTIPDTFNYKVGSKEWMLKQAGLDSDTIYKKIKSELK